MKKFTRAIGALVFAVVMSLTFSAVAFAEEGAAFAEDAAGMASANFTVKFIPEAGLNVPAMDFYYTVESADGDAAATPIVYEGVEGISVTQQVSFTANDSEAANGKEATITFPAAGVFPHAGIYRYTLTQSAFTPDQVNAGILNEKGNGKAVVKKLDLYVDKDGRVISAVLFNSTSKSGSFDNTFGKAGTTPDPENPDPDDPTPDEPGPGTPENAGKHVITLSKVVSGDMGDQNELFPFTFVASSDNPTLAGVQFVSSFSQDPWTIGSTYDIQMKHGDSITITVPNDVAVAIRELTSEAEGYTITSTAGGFNANPTTVTKVSEDTGFSGILNNAVETATVAYENNRENISPTGVVLTFAPYLFIVAAGALIFAVSRRRKSELND